MKLNHFLLSFVLLSISVQAQTNNSETRAVNAVINSWHSAASKADFETYFNLMSEDAIFIGTDASENWNKKEFKHYAKPHFDKGKAWDFKSLERNIYFSKDKKTAWFDELLDTQMKICRGSGVLIKIKKEWKIAQYVLSIAIPNELSKEVIKIKSNSDNLLIDKLTNK